MQTLVILAAIYGNLVGGDLVKAPYAVKEGGYNVPVYSLTEAQANAHGWLLVLPGAPTPPEGQYATNTYWAVEANRIVRKADFAPIPPRVRRWTPLSIKRSAVRLGHWDALKAFLTVANAYDDFIMAQYEAEDDADFVRLMAAARQQLGDEVVDAVLNGAEEE